MHICEPVKMFSILQQNRTAGILFYFTITRALDYLRKYLISV